MSYSDIPGWSAEIEPFYRRMAPRIPQGGRFVEVGVFLGRSFALMGELRPDVEMWAIDPWKDGTSQGYDGTGIFTDHVRQNGGTLFRAFTTGLARHSPAVFDRAHIVRAESHLVTIPEADFVFIDGAHDYQSVRRDIVLYHAMVRKPGGIISGHDYAPGFEGLMKAVDEYFQGGAKIEPEGPCRCWWVQC